MNNAVDYTVAVVPASKHPLFAGLDPGCSLVFVAQRDDFLRWGPSVPPPPLQHLNAMTAGRFRTVCRPGPLDGFVCRGAPDQVRDLFLGWGFVLSSAWEDAVAEQWGW